jgi:hypothetical protein
MCDMLHKGGRHVEELHEVAEPLKGFQQDEEPLTRETRSMVPATIPLELTLPGFPTTETGGWHALGSLSCR